MSRAFDYLFSVMVFEFILTLLYGMCVIPIVLLYEFIQRHATAPVLAFVEVIKAPVSVALLGGLLGTGLIAHDAASRVAVGSNTFWKALTAALGQARFNASYVPLIGKWTGIRHTDEHSIDRPIE